MTLFGLVGVGCGLLRYAFDFACCLAVCFVGFVVLCYYVWFWCRLVLRLSFGFDYAVFRLGSCGMLFITVGVGLFVDMVGDLDLWVCYCWL